MRTALVEAGRRRRGRSELAEFGGAVAIDIQGFVIAAVIALVLLGVLNGLRMLGNLSRVLRA